MLTLETVFFTENIHFFTKHLYSVLMFFFKFSELINTWNSFEILELISKTITNLAENDEKSSCSL